LERSWPALEPKVWRWQTTRLETRTKESISGASIRVGNPGAERKRHVRAGGERERNPACAARARVRLEPSAQPEWRWWDPKGGELCLARTKPEETLVEVRSRSDVQIDGRSWV